MVCIHTYTREPLGARSIRPPMKNESLARHLVMLIKWMEGSVLSACAIPGMAAGPILEASGGFGGSV